MHRRRPPVAWLAAGLLGFAAAWSMPACNAARCTPNALAQDEPSPSIECPSGELCYQGDCIRVCNAGQERATRCASNDECGAARPRCVDGFCSACEQGEVCIPTLDVCQPVLEVILPDPPPVPSPGPRDNVPLDGGLPMGGLTRNLDAGVGGPAPEVEVTHIGFADLAQVEDFALGSPPPTQSVARVVGFDARGNGVGLKWRADLDPPAVQCEDDDADRDGCGARTTYDFEQCTIRALRTVTSTTPTSRPPTTADIGDINIDSHVDFPGSINVPLAASFDTMVGRYGLAPANLPLDLLVYSALPFDQRYLSVTSGGNTAVTAGSWPNSPASVFLGHHVPFRLEPSQTTRTLLETGAQVASPAANDLVFQWTRIDTGDDSFERVIVRVQGNDHELFCDAVEGQNGEDTIVIPAVTLNAWRLRESAGTYPLIFERASTQRLPINPQPDLLIDFTVRVRHSLVSDVVFQ